MELKFLDIKNILPSFRNKISKIHSKNRILGTLEKDSELKTKIFSLVEKWIENNTYDDDLVKFLIFIINWSNEFPDLMKKFIAREIPDNSDQFVKHLDYKEGVIFDFMKNSIQAIKLTSVKSTPKVLSRIKDFIEKVYSQNFNDFKDLLRIIFNLESDADNLWSLMEIIEDDIKELLKFDFKGKLLSEVALEALLDMIGQDPILAVSQCILQFAEKLDMYIRNFKPIEFKINRDQIKNLLDSHKPLIKKLSELFIERARAEVSDKSIGISETIYIEGIKNTWIWREYFKQKFGNNTNIIPDDWECIKQQLSEINVKIKEISL